MRLPRDREPRYMLTVTDHFSVDRVTRRRRSPAGCLIAAAVIVIAAFAAMQLGPVRRVLDSAWERGWAMFDEIAGVETPASGPEAVPAEDYTPLREARAGRSGANVRDYPLLSGELLANLSAGTPLTVTGRLNVQGQWWFRVVLDDGRVGFVREDVLRWGAAVSNPSRFRVEEIAQSAIAGPQGARLRAGPSLDARALVRLEPGAAMTLTGRLRQNEHWWYRVALSDGRIGFVRDDVLTLAAAP